MLTGRTKGQIYNKVVSMYVCTRLSLGRNNKQNVHPLLLSLPPNSISLSSLSHDMTKRNKTFARTFQTLYIAPILSIYTAVPFWQYYTEWKIVGWLKGRREKRKVFDSRVRLLCFGTCFYIRHALCKRIVQLVEKNLHFQVAPLDFNIQLIVWIAIVSLSESEQCHHKLDVS